MEGKTVKYSRIIMAIQMNPEDANPAGNVHGGVIMKYVDTAAGVVSIRHARKLAVTASIDRLDFHHPVFVGDLLILKAGLNMVGRSSMEVGVRVEAENILTGEVRHTASAYLTFVALDKEGKPVGSELIGQAFSDPMHFWGRPSATGPIPNNASSSGGSNLGPTNPALMDAVKARVQALRAADPGNLQPVPVDLVTASASGLDPHVSPAAVEYQLARVARVRNINPDTLHKLVAKHTEGRQFGILGEPRVNVLELNLALDATH